MQAYQQQGARFGHAVDVIDVAEFQRLPEYDAAYLRLDTDALGLSFAASRYAWELGMRIVDDPISMLTCMNKAHVQGLLERAEVPTPDTLLLTREALKSLDPTTLFAELGEPIICKAPSGAFSSAVEKARNAKELVECVRRFSLKSDVVLVQRYTPSAFDWRVGMLCDRVLYAAKYHIPKGAWRIHDTPEGETRKQWARIERVPLDKVPPAVIGTAKAACRVIGRGLYGVDMKELSDGRVVVIEVNDNPNIDWDSELEADSPMFGEIIDLIARGGPRA